MRNYPHFMSVRYIIRVTKDNVRSCLQADNPCFLEGRELC